MNLRSGRLLLAELRGQIEADQSARGERAKAAEMRYGTAKRSKITPGVTLCNAQI